MKWLCSILIEIGFNVKTPVAILSDNQSAIKMAQNDIEHDRTKHIDIKYYFIRDEINNKQVSVQWIRTESQVADIFTKALTSPSFLTHRNRLIHEKK